MRYYIVDAFTERPFGGNTAGVVVLNNAFFPAERLMQTIAAELRYSETVFIRRSKAGAWEARYFTPHGEVDLCGHATIAAFALLYRLRAASGTLRLLSKAGELKVEVGEKVLMQMASPRIVSTVESTSSIYEALGLQVSLCSILPVQVVSTGLPDLMIQVPSVEVLNTLQPDMDAVAELTRQYEAISFHVFALANDGYTAHVRDFAPACGIPEESATGTANAALTHYLATHDIIATGDHRFLQGEAMGRPSVVETSLRQDGSVWVGGSAAIVAEGRLCV